MLEAIARSEPTHDRVLVGLTGLSDLADPAVTAALLHRQEGLPRVDYLSIDGEGDPNTATAYAHAVEALYSTAYTIKFAQRAHGHDIAVGPLEGLWRASDPRAFTDRTKDAWWWTMLLPQPPFVTAEDGAEAVATVRRKKPHLDTTLVRLSLRQLRHHRWT